MKSRIRSFRVIALIVFLLAVVFCLTGCQESNSAKYDRATKLLSEGKYAEAIAVFDEIAMYEDASKMSMYAKAIEAAESGDFDKAIASFTALGDFKDCALMISYYTGRQAEVSVYEGDTIHPDKWFEAIRAYETVPLFRDSRERADACRAAAYAHAVECGDAGDPDFAASVMTQLGDYSDAEKQAIYYEAAGLRIDGKYKEASRTFARIPGFRDADTLATAVMDEGYAAAEALAEAGKLDEAHELFLALGDYKDAPDRAYQIYYDAGIARREAKDWDGARGAFEQAGTYSDAQEQISETWYLQAKAFMDSGDYDGAYAILTGLEGYKDVDSLLREDDNLIAAAAAAAAAAARAAKLKPYQTAGSIVTFGTYPQTSAGDDRTPIEWIVLDYDAANHRALLLSRYGLDAKPYNTTKTDVTWETCSLRAWLNGEFLNQAFSPEEQSAILLTTVDNSEAQGYSRWSTSGGNNTQDRIFLLSYAEANRYFGVKHREEEGAGDNIASRMAPTAYAIKDGASVGGSISKTADGAAAGLWWLRSPGYYQSSAARVNLYGSLDDYRVDYDLGCARPAFWLNLESDIF